MRKISLFILFSLLAANLFAHAGEVHTYMGTVTMLHGSNTFMMKTSARKELTISTAKTTLYLHADGRPAKQSEVVVGRRVVVTMAKDGKTATRIKIGAMSKR